jgi:hypothetical protein
MHGWQILNREGWAGDAGQVATSLKVHLLSCCAIIILISALTAMAQNPTAPGGALRMDRVDQETPVNQAPDPNTQMLMHSQQSNRRNYAAANAERRKQIAEDSARLLKLATDLKAEVDKTTKDTLSLNVIRKADDIENLAHSVKEKMKLTVAAN